MFGQIKAGLGFRNFLLRGLAKMQGEWKLVCLTHNLLKLFRSGALAVGYNARLGDVRHGFRVHAKPRLHVLAPSSTSFTRGLESNRTTTGILIFSDLTGYATQRLSGHAARGDSVMTAVGCIGLVSQAGPSLTRYPSFMGVFPHSPVTERS